MLRRILLAASLFAPVAAHASWQEGSSTHFLVYSDDTPANVKAMTTDLERFDKAVRVALKLPEPVVGPDARVIVFVLPAMSDVQKMMGDQNANVGGYYNTSYPSGPFAFVPKHSPDESERTLTPRNVLQHEYTHHIMYSSWGDVVFPTWFSEGFAELFATARNEPNGNVLIGTPPGYRAYGIDQMNVVPVERLVGRGPDYHDGLAAQVFYGRAWLLTDYLMFDKARSKQLAAYIAAINDGKPAAEANKLIGITPSLDLRLNSYVQHSQFPSAVLDAKELTIDPVTTRALTPGEAATMWARMRSHNGVDKKQAQEVVALARTAAAPYPNDAGAQNELAEAEFDAGNPAASEAAADRALAADPQSVHAMIYKGMAQIEQLKKAGSKDAARWTTARRWFLAANKADRFYSYPVELYYESFADAGEPATKAAKDGLLYAYKLSPQNQGLRLEAADVLLADGNVKAARVALEPIAYSPHGGASVDTAKKVIAALDSGGASAAIATIESERAKAKADAEKAKPKGGKAS